jgi:hypothetical protein
MRRWGIEVPPPMDEIEAKLKRDRVEAIDAGK